MDFLAIASGFGVGTVIGMTGVGGGSLMTPLLIQVFRLSPAIAIGTDLWFAALTKSSGAIAHHRQGHVDLSIVASMLAGSLPAAVATIFAMHAAGIAKGANPALAGALGIALLLTAITIAYRGAWQGLGLKLESWFSPRRRRVLTVACGALLGVLVSFSSIGAGAIGATLIVLLYPRLPAKLLVGTDIAHAVPLTLVAGIGHMWLGNVDWTLLASLVLGSVPGIWLGARLTRRLPETAVRALLFASLVTAGLKVIH